MLVYGLRVAKNLIKHGHKLFVVANKNRVPIDKIIYDGAEEAKDIGELCNKELDVLFLCVTNTPIAISIAEKLLILLTSKTLIIDITTHNQNGSKDMDKILAKNISYVECPVMGGPVQAADGLGGIVGATEENFKLKVI